MAKTLANFHSLKSLDQNPGLELDHWTETLWTPILCDELAKLHLVQRARVNLRPASVIKPSIILRAKVSLL